MHVTAIELVNTDINDFHSILTRDDFHISMCEEFIRARCKNNKKEFSCVAIKRINSGIAYVRKKNPYAIIVDIKIPLLERQFFDVT